MGSDYLSRLVSQITSEHMTKIIFRSHFFGDSADEMFGFINWKRLAHALSEPRFARLQRVEIWVIVYDPWPEEYRVKGDEWASMIRTEMDVLDRRGCLHVQVEFDFW